MHRWYDAPIRGQLEAWCRFLESGGVFKLEFGPKAFIVVSDPVVARHLLKVLPWSHAPRRCWEGVL